MTNPQFLAFQGWITTEDPTTKVTVAPSVSAESFNNECKIKGKLEDTNTAPTVFIFAGNATDSFKHHGPESSLYSHKAGGGQAKAAAQLGKAGIPTLSLPTSGIDVLKDGDPIPKVAQDAVADLWKAVGNGCNLALLTRKPNTKKSDGAPIPATYYFADKFADGTEPAFWGGIDETPNPHLSKFYFEQLELIRDYIAAPDKTKFLEAKKIKNDDPRIKALKLGEDVKNGSKSDPWFDKKVVDAAAPAPTDSPAGKTTTPSLIKALGEGNCAFDSLFLAIAGEIIKGTFDDLGDPKKKAFQEKFLKLCKSVEGIKDRKPLTWEKLKEFLLENKTKEQQEDLQRKFELPLRKLAIDLLTKKNPDDPAPDLTKLTEFGKANEARVRLTFLSKALVVFGLKTETPDEEDNFNLGAHELLKPKFKEIAERLKSDGSITDADIAKYKEYLESSNTKFIAEAKVFEDKLNKAISNWWLTEGARQYTEEMRKDKRWASDIELAALSTYFNVGVAIKTSKSQYFAGPIKDYPITLVNEDNKHFDCWSDSAWLNWAQGNRDKNNNTATVDNDHIAVKLNLKLPEQKKAIEDLCAKHTTNPMNAWVKESDTQIKVKGHEITLTDDGVRCKKLKGLDPSVQEEVIRAQVEIMAERYKAAGIHPDTWHVNLTLCEEDKTDPNIFKAYKKWCDYYGFGLNGSKPPVKTGLAADSSASKTSGVTPPTDSKKSKWEDSAYDPAAEERKVKHEEDAVAADRVALEKSKKDDVIHAEAERRVKAVLDAEKALLGTSPDADVLATIDAKKDAAIKDEKTKIQKRNKDIEDILEGRETKVKLARLDLDEEKLNPEEKNIELKVAELSRREAELKIKHAREEANIKAKFTSLSTTAGASAEALKAEREDALNRMGVNHASDNEALMREQNTVAKLRKELDVKKKKIKDAREKLEAKVPVATASSSSAATATATASSTAGAGTSASDVSPDKVVPPTAAPSTSADASTATGAAPAAASSPSLKAK